MRRAALYALGPGVLLLLASPRVDGAPSRWNYENHKAIARRAVDLLPADVKAFYAPRLQKLEAYAIEPDEIKGRDKSEGPHHYWHMDHCDVGALRAKNFPAPATTVDGDLSWRLAQVYAWLIDAIKKNHEESILKWSGYVAHYVGDAHMPLHATYRYDCGLKETLNHDHGTTWEKHLHARIDDCPLTDVDYDRRLKALKYEFKRADSPMELAFAVLGESRVLADEIWKTDLANKTDHRVSDNPYHADRIADRLARSSLVLADVIRTAWETARGAANPSTNPNPTSTGPPRSDDHTRPAADNPSATKLPAPTAEPARAEPRSNRTVVFILVIVGAVWVVWVVIAARRSPGRSSAR